MGITSLQSSMIGYMGKPSTVFGGYSEENGILVVAVATDFRRERRANHAVITNDSGIQDRDSFYKADSLKPAIAAYYRLKNGVAQDGKSHALQFDARAANANPSAVIESDGYDESGARYRLAEGVGNAHIAVLAMCLYVAQLRGMNDAMDMMDKIGKREALNAGRYQSFGGEVGGDQEDYAPHHEPFYAKRIFRYGFQVDPRFDRNGR